MAALGFVVLISSTSLPGGNLVDGLPPAASPNYNEKSTILDRSRVQPKQRDVALRVARLVFLIIFVTSCYVLNKIVILSEISIPE